MANVAEATEATTTSAETPESITFGGTSRNLVPGMAMLAAGLGAFFMGMTDVFFAEATAWVFIIWGLLLIYTGLIDALATYEVTEDALVIRDVMRPWNSTRTWNWAYVSRLDVVTHRKDRRPSDAKMQVYFTPEGELGLEREDRSFDPKLAELIVERAGLKPAGPDHPSSMDALPLQQNVTFTWQ
jgi:hypothetical protein